MDNIELEQEDQTVKAPKLYVERQKSVFADGKMYLDGDRLHELLLEHAANPDKPIGNELGRMYLAIVTNLMKSLNYKRYTSDWRELMKHTALYYMIKYCHNYNPEKGAIRRQELNAKRKKPLPPVDNGKAAFNYVSWTANTALFSTVAKLNERKEKDESIGLDETRLLDVNSLDEDVLNYYNMKRDEHVSATLDEEGDTVDILAHYHKLKLEERISQYAEGALVAAKKYLEKYPNRRAKVADHLKFKWGVDLETGEMYTKEMLQEEDVTGRRKSRERKKKNST